MWVSHNDLNTSHLISLTACVLKEISIHHTHIQPCRYHLQTQDKVCNSYRDTYLCCTRTRAQMSELTRRRGKATLRRTGTLARSPVTKNHTLDTRVRRTREDEDEEEEERHRDASAAAPPVPGCGRDRIVGGTSFSTAAAARHITRVSRFRNCASVIPLGPLHVHTMFEMSGSARLLHPFF